MPITLNSTLDGRTRGGIQGCVHCTTLPALCSILQTGRILCSNDVRQAQDRQDISRTISSRDRNKPGANGVYARFLLRQKTVPFAEFGTSGARPVRIYMAKSNCFDLPIISTAISDYKGATVATGNLSDLSEQNVFNAEVCFAGSVSTSAFTSIYIKRQDKRKIQYGSFPSSNKFRHSIAQIIVEARNADDFRAGINKGRSHTDIAEENVRRVTEVCEIFHNAGFTRVSKESNDYYKFTR